MSYTAVSPLLPFFVQPGILSLHVPLVITRDRQLERIAAFMSRVDHIVVAVRDLTATSSLILERLGLAAYAGGRITGIGTESYIIPIGGGYIELISVCEEREAVANPLGRAVQAAIENNAASFLTWAVEPGDSVQPTADRLELAANPIKRALPEGGDVTCRVAGLQEALNDPVLPYFVEWESQEERPDQVDVEHKLEPTGFAWIEIAGERKQVEDWLGDKALPLQFTEGGGGVQAVAIMTEGEQLILRAPLDFSALPTGQSTQQSAEKEGPETARNADLEGEGREVGPTPSMFNAVLESVENAVESAAVAVEGVAGQLLCSPTVLPK